MAKKQEPRDERGVEAPEELEGGELLDVGEELELLLPPAIDPSAEAAEVARRGRQGDQHRPTCPRCSTPEKPILLVAASSPGLFTWYACPNDHCPHRIKVPRPNIQQIMGRARQAEGEDFSAR